jgi:hypothetical protein
LSNAFVLSGLLLEAVAQAVVDFNIRDREQLHPLSAGHRTEEIAAVRARSH